LGNQTLHSKGGKGYMNSYIQAITGATGLAPSKINTFLQRFPDSHDSNNCRYDLIYGWVKQGAINFKQMKSLIKNIKIKKIEDWKKNNGDNLFIGHQAIYIEDHIEC
jgi:hypothetical protein